MRRALTILLLILCGLVHAQDTTVISILEDVNQPAPQTVATPTITPNGGTFTTAPQVILACSEPGARIYYTLRGGTPTVDSTLYTGPISIDLTTTIKAIGIKSGYTNSAVASAVFIINISPTVYNPDFPRIGAYSISGSKTYGDADFRSKIKKVHVFISGTWPNWSHNGYDYKALVDEIHAQSEIPEGTIVLKYIVVDEATYEPVDGANAAYHGLYTKLEAKKWWLYNSGLTGTPIAAEWPKKHRCNSTLHTSTDADGYHWCDWLPHALVETFRNGNGAVFGLATQRGADDDGTFVDNMFHEPRSNGDWDIDGTSDLRTDQDIIDDYIAGNVRTIDQLEEDEPGKYRTGNLVTLRHPGTDPGAMNQKMHGGIMEGMIGETWSAGGTTGNTALLMKWYEKLMAMMKEPKLGIFCAYVPIGNYAKERYGLTACLMGNGYYYMYSASLTYSQTLRRMPEYDFNLGKPLQNPQYVPNLRPSTLGSPVGYQREYENGIAINNPVGAGTRTYLLLGNWYKVPGDVAFYTVSGGSSTPITEITLVDGSGIVLSRTPTNN